MRKNFISKALSFFIFSFVYFNGNAQDTKPDTVSIGVYMVNIHDLDIKQEKFTANIWVWLKYKNKEFDFYNNLDVPQAKTVARSFVTVDSSDGRIYMKMKLQCELKDSWRFPNFPFDRQKLRISFQNSKFDSRYMIFVLDTNGSHFDPRFSLRGWSIDSLTISTGTNVFETGLGEEELSTQRIKYSSLRIRLAISREEASGLFWKMFLGMYIAFLVSYVCFYIHADAMDSRFGLGVGSLFAVIGNKYIVDSALPESSSFTLVDLLHWITLFFILATIAANAYSLYLIKKHKMGKAYRFDRLASWVVLICYVLLNVWLIWKATKY